MNTYISQDKPKIQILTMQVKRRTDARMGCKISQYIYLI